jgi:hypothetical protein
MEDTKKLEWYGGDMEEQMWSGLDLLYQIMLKIKCEWKKVGDKFELLQLFKLSYGIMVKYN